MPSLTTIYLVGASGRQTLSAWFAACDKKLVITAEHGYFIRHTDRHESEWTTCVSVASFDWKQIAEPIMELYIEATDGSSIEAKDSCIVWRYQDADPDFGSCQPKEQILSAMQRKGIHADFVLFASDDRFDEDMFQVINGAVLGPTLSPVAEVFACIVEQKPSKAKYYLEDTTEIIRMLQGLTNASDIMMHHPASSSRGSLYE